MPPGTSKTEEQKEFALPIGFFTDGQKYDVVDVLKNYTKLKLLLYGTRDKFTTSGRVKEVFELIPQPTMIHELHTEHDYRCYQDIIEEINQAIGRFLDKYPIQ
jgi:hypothetical protein